MAPGAGGAVVTGTVVAVTFSPLHDPGPVIVVHRDGVVWVVSAPERASMAVDLLDLATRPGLTPGIAVVTRPDGRWVVIGDAARRDRVLYRVTGRCCAVAYLLERVA